MGKKVKFSEFWASNWGFVVKNLLLAAVIITVILVVVIHRLEKYTEHGIEVEVPQVTGLYLEEAEVLLGSSNLRMEVIDSTFSNKVPLGTIVEQIPGQELKAKRGRVVYVVVNARQRKQVIIPEIHDISYRQAQGMLSRLGLIVDSIEYEPSEYKDLVLALRRGENMVETGDKVTEGTALIMVVGFGKGTEMVRVPNLRGLRLKDVRGALLMNRLTLGSIEYDVEPTETDMDEYMVYMQEPQEGKMYLEGSSVSIKLSKDQEKTVTADNKEDEEIFF